MTTSAVARTRYRAFSGAVVVALAVVNVVDHAVHPPWWVRALEGAGLLAAARLAGLSWAQLGLARDRLGRGARWALGVIGVVAGAYVVGVLVPLSRGAFQDEEYHVPLPDALHLAFVAIPLGTVVLEEIAFRSVLWGALSRHCRPWQVLATTSVLFGFWHLIPAVRGPGGALAVVGVLALTTAGGLVFGELRRRSDSVLASAGAHWATNALGVLFGLLAWRLSPDGP
ncbi:CPBP family intramembrane glutamic endopeptidase [Blastococcus sp. URHD0036]|uniref:CPBP family intramembrane glutamic endopeptidase n=1 Tax=Blastococcus sp. URHD0036 TaxID=1380356 RepID=UPI000552A940|nr:CPBP family intramembrane glutamic endopeptidase [Blastococcus sp. URHD0036]